MILAITEQYHDYEPSQYFIDTEKLDSKNPVDAAILKECNKKSKNLKVFVDASDWEDNPDYDCEPGVTDSATFKKNKGAIDKSVYLTIDFDC